EFRLPDLEALAAEIVGRSETAMRAAIRALPDGTYHASGDYDGYDQDVHLEVTLRVRDDEVEADYAGTSPASDRGLNVVLDYTHAYTPHALTAELTPEVPNNEGSFRPVRVSAPLGCILNCQRPSAVAA